MLNRCPKCQHIMLMHNNDGSCPVEVHEVVVPTVQEKVYPDPVHWQDSYVVGHNPHDWYIPIISIKGIPPGDLRLPVPGVVFSEEDRAECTINWHTRDRWVG